MPAGLGHAFRDAALLRQALSHRSVGAHNNERLEFLGDALLNVCVAEMLYQAHPHAHEGELTRMRARLVNEAALAEIARGIELGDSLLLGPGELKSGGFRRDSILADALEALLGAVYLDAGWQACRDCVRRLFEVRLAQAAQGNDKDAKTRLQEWLQARGLALPDYVLTGSSGADHAKVFTVECRSVGLATPCVASGNSRRAAEQSAASRALELLVNADDPPGR